MPINSELKQRNNELCELCNSHSASEEYTVSPKNNDSINNQVALCQKCFTLVNSTDAGFYWRCIEGSIWSDIPSVKALSYRIANNHKKESWAENLINSVDLDEETQAWAMSVFNVAEVHKDAFGNILENGDTVVLIQALNVKGTNFTASKGTVIKKIKLVQDNIEQIEGKINEQTIVLLCKYLKKN